MLSRAELYCFYDYDNDNDNDNECTRYFAESSAG